MNESASVAAEKPARRSQSIRCGKAALLDIAPGEQQRSVKGKRVRNRRDDPLDIAHVAAGLMPRKRNSGCLGYNIDHLSPKGTLPWRGCSVLVLTVCFRKPVKWYWSTVVILSVLR